MSKFALAASCLFSAVQSWVLYPHTTYDNTMELDEVYNGLGGTHPHVGVARWTMPEDPQSEKGLGGGLTFGYEHNFCEKIIMKFKEENNPNTAIYPFVSCAEIKEAIARGFSVWSMNNKFIKFVDVTEKCLYNPDNTTCVQEEPEIKIMCADGTEEPSLAAYVKHSWYDMPTTRAYEEQTPRLTNGVYAGGGYSIKSTQFVFNTHICWYLDNYFCFFFFSMGESAVTVMRVVSMALFAIAAIVALYFVVTLVNILLKHGLSKVVDRLMEMKMLWVIMVLFFMLFPPLFYTRVFLPCNDCFDFEATATHEIGHILGFQHPNETPDKNFGLCPSDVATPKCTAVQDMLVTPHNTGDKPGEGVCFEPTADPESIMTSVTRHAARACLTQNDMQGMAVLYPCGTPYQDEAFNTESLCVKSKRNTGLLRLAQVMLLPLAIVSVAIVLLIESGTYRKKQKIKKINTKDKKSAKAKKREEKQKALQRANFTDGFTEGAASIKSSFSDKASMLFGQTPTITSKNLKASSAHFGGMEKFQASISKAPGQKLGVTLHVVPEGVCISKCTEGGVMSTAGLRKGDVIMMANGEFLDTSEHFSRLVLNNQSVLMQVIRPAYITATLTGGKMGMKVKQLGDTLIVQSLTKGGGGETAGLKEKDTLLTVEGIDLRDGQTEDKDPKEILQQCFKQKQGAVTFHVRRMNTKAVPSKAEEAALEEERKWQMRVSGTTNEV